MEYTQKREPYKDYILITIGTFLLALAISLFYEPFNLVTGGISGLGIIIKNYTNHIIPGGIPVGVTNAFLNVPLFLMALIKKGKNFGARSLVSTILLSVFLLLTSTIKNPVEDLLLATVFGGVLSGIGLGLVFTAYSTTGGTDLAASLLHPIFPYISVAVIMLILDWTIITMGVFVFGITNSMYAIISVFIAARVIDAILDGLHFSKAAFIISEHEKIIAQNIMEELDRGVTGLLGQGMWTGDGKNVLMCIVSKREIVKLKQIVRCTDDKAFVVVTDVREVLGEGFKEYTKSTNK